MVNRRLRHCSKPDFVSTKRTEDQVVSFYLQNNFKPPVQLKYCPLRQNTDLRDEIRYICPRNLSSFPQSFAPGTVAITNTQQNLSK